MNVLTSSSVIAFLRCNTATCDQIAPYSGKRSAVTYRLERACELLQHFDAARFELASKKASSAVILE